MKYNKFDQSYFIFIEKGELVMEALTHFCKNTNIKNGQVSGIGAVKCIELGAYDLENKFYIRRNFDSIYELVSFQGNITLKKEEPFIHAHITIGNHKMEIHGGHLFEMTVAVVGEFILRRFDGKILREMDEEIGIPICNFPEEKL